MRDQWLNAVRDRIARYTDDHDTSAILDPEALREARQLLPQLYDSSAQDEPAHLDAETLHTLGWLHWCRYHALPEGEDQADLQAAYRLFQPLYQTDPNLVPEPLHPLLNTTTGQAGDLPQAQNEQTPQAWHDQAVRLLQHVLRSDDQQALDEAVVLLRRVLSATPADHPNRAMYLSNLGGALQVRFERAGNTTDLDQAVAVWRAAAGVRSAPAGVRMGAARAWGAVAADYSADWRMAAEGYATAVSLLPMLAWRGLDRASQEHQLADWVGLASDAAACAVAASQPERAVELLEHGRSVLWTQALETRTDLSELQDVHPGLADRLDKLRTDLDQGTGDPAAGSLPAAGEVNVADAVNAQRQEADRRMRWAREWDEILAEVRRLPGFEGFLFPPRFDRLRSAGADGPVVTVNISRYRCDALAVTPDGVQVVELPDLTEDDAVERANLYLAAVHRLEGDDYTGGEGYAALQQVILATLEWLWDTVAGPVLDALGGLATLGYGQVLPRVWWCPTGPLTVLPLHAAGYHDPDDGTTDDTGDDHPGARPGRTVLDRVVSSYTSTLRTLIRARQETPATSEPDRLLVVAMPQTPRLKPLPGAQAEHDLLTRRFPGSHTAYVNTRATRDAILAALRTHPFAHFACHGGQNLADPTRGGIYLHDGPVTVADIARLNLQHAELAFLSACQTAIGGVRLLDEAIHLAAALQLAGYRHVIATLWSIADQPAPQIADGIYAALTCNGSIGPAHAAQALHHTIRDLRDRHPDDPTLWALYLHTGP